MSVLISICVSLFLLNWLLFTPFAVTWSCFHLLLTFISRSDKIVNIEIRNVLKWEVFMNSLKEKMLETELTDQQLGIFYLGQVKVLFPDRWIFK